MISVLVKNRLETCIYVITHCGLAIIRKFQQKMAIAIFAPIIHTRPKQPAKLIAELGVKTQGGLVLGETLRAPTNTIAKTPL
jgi:BioD-like phosphotransacetylase family protein